MATKIIFEKSYLVSGIMCYESCGSIIKNSLHCTLEDLKMENLLPDHAQLLIDAEPQVLGIHRLFIKISVNEETVNLSKDIEIQIAEEMKKGICFDVIDEAEITKDASKKVNWINIVINLIAIIAIIVLTTVFPPSLPLTAGLFAISFLSTAFTARHYLINFIKNLRAGQIANMTTTVTLGWLLSLAHSLYHSIIMPLASSFSMIFMSFVMPVMLITVINAMDEIKRQVLTQSKKMHLEGIKALFPQMMEHYTCYSLADPESEQLLQQLTTTDFPFQMDLQNPQIEAKNALKKGMLIRINPGECFPVDCILVQGNTVIDGSLLTGEPREENQFRDFIPAGALNLSQSVLVYATKNSYDSTVNQLLFKANRARDKSNITTTPVFNYLYAALIVTGLVAAIVTPLALGLFSIPLLVQNITGILFEICPCTIAIAHQLPHLISVYQRHKKGVVLREVSLSDTAEIHTIVFDKTGTLTTGNSQVESSEGITDSLWARVYLLEKQYGAEHPLARAITHYYEARQSNQIIINDIDQMQSDPQNRGISAIVQGRQVHIGNAQYLQEAGIDVPAINNEKAALGFSPVYVAQDEVYQGVIYVKHELRKDILPALSRLKREGKKIFMLTGDTEAAAQGFNQQNGAIFDSDNILAEQKPKDKEDFLKKLMSAEGINTKGVWFIGDGLNDAPCARMVTEKGGVSCAMTSDDKAAFFTDISLNGSLDYLFVHHKINRFLKKNVWQNQGLLTLGALAFLAFILTFSVAGIAVPPLIPLLIMSFVTGFVILNSYRLQLSIDHALDKSKSALKEFLASDWAIGLLVVASVLLISALLMATVASGGLAFPAFVFTAGTVAAVSSSCVVASGTLLVAFGVLLGLSATVDHCVNLPEEEQRGVHYSPSPLSPSRLPLATAKQRFVEPADKVFCQPDSLSCG